MFDKLNKYNQKGHFFLLPNNSLKEVCNAPTDKSGVYLVYALANGRIELIYIGCAEVGGIKDRIVNDDQFGKVPRHKSWPNQMEAEGIEALDIYWYVTHGKDFSDCPMKLKEELLQVFRNIYGKLPRWNER